MIKYSNNHKLYMADGSITDRRSGSEKPAALRVVAKTRCMLLLLLVYVSLFTTGCGGGSIYDNVNDDVTQIAGEGLKYDNMSWHDALVASCYDFYMASRHVAPIIIVGSIVFGAALYTLIRKYKALRRVAVFVFIIGIPLVTFVLVYGMAILLGAFR